MGHSYLYIDDEEITHLPKYQMVGIDFLIDGQNDENQLTVINHVTLEWVCLPFYILDVPTF